MSPAARPLLATQRTLIAARVADLDSMVYDAGAAERELRQARDDGPQDSASTEWVAATAGLARLWAADAQYNAARSAYEQLHQSGEFPEAAAALERIPTADRG